LSWHEESTIKVDHHQSSWATAEDLRSFAGGSQFGGAPVGKKKGKEELLSTPSKMELEGPMAEEKDTKPSGILHHNGVDLESNPIPSVVGFVGELTDDGIIWSGSANSKMRKPGMAKSTTFTHALLLQQAQGAALL
jgi:hypothetical protein